MHYPELIAPLNGDDLDVLDDLPENFVAVHLWGSEPKKCVPMPAMLCAGLVTSGVKFVVLGNEPADYLAPGLRVPPKIALQIAVMRRARKFIGTLSMWNCVAQVFAVPSFVLVNRSIKEPYIYRLMEQNHATVRAWNVEHGRGPYGVYAEAVEWAKL